MSSTKNTEWRGKPGSSAQPAVDHRPADDASCDDRAEDTPRNTPHGLPISLEEYERLKARARFEKASSSSGGQQDPAVDSEREDEPL